jgi:hypothetical protein
LITSARIFCIPQPLMRSCGSCRPTLSPMTLGAAERALLGEPMRSFRPIAVLGESALAHWVRCT